MTEFIEFCREYGVYVLTFVCFVVEIIFIFVKRKPKSFDDFVLALSEARNSLSNFIISVEAPGNGVEKKDKVIKSGISAMEKMLDRKLSDSEVSYVSDCFARDIEIILATPQKKEIK